MNLGKHTTTIPDRDAGISTVRLVLESKEEGLTTDYWLDVGQARHINSTTMTVHNSFGNMNYSEYVGAYEKANDNGMYTDLIEQVYRRYLNFTLRC